MRVFVIAGEPSGDALGAALMVGLRSLVPDVTFRGIGGPGMEAEGMESLFPMSDLSVMGLAEILPRYPHLRRRLKQTIRAVLEEQPDVLITVDSPDFCLRVARGVKARSRTRIVHYVSPTVWAWRPRRAQRLKGVVDQVLALFPFEPPYLERVGIACDFVGHPVVTQPQASEAEAAAFRLAHGLGDAPALLLLPGSRGGEVARMMPVMGEVMGLLSKRLPRLRPVLVAAPSVAGQVSAALETWPVAPLVVDPREAGASYAAEKRAAFRAADIALAASGTVSLELAAAQTPMVIAYDMHRLTRAIMKRMLLTDTVTLVNLVSDTRAVPEFLGELCQPGPITAAICATLDDPRAQAEAMALCMERLGAGGEAPGLRAARAVLARMGPSAPGSAPGG
ncbi:MAG: lipid-A-disaccharide synthase [Pseudooceanicola sp.]